MNNNALIQALLIRVQSIIDLRTALNKELEYIQKQIKELEND